MVRVSTQLALSHAQVGDPQATAVVVLLPGLADPWRSYERVLPHMAPSLRTLALSQRGHGDSDKPQTDYAVRDYAADLESFLDALLVWGDRDAVTGREATDLLARAVRSSKLVVYEGVGHTPHWEDPERFARDVSAFALNAARRAQPEPQ